VLLGFSVSQARGDSQPAVPILVSHRFGVVVTDSMTVTTPVFTSHLQYLRENPYAVSPLRQFFAYRVVMSRRHAPW